MPVVIPELVYVIGLFFAVCGYLVARGLLAGWSHSLGYVLQWLGRELTFKIPLPFKSFTLDIGGPFRALDNIVRTAVQDWATGAEIEIGYCLHGLGRVGQLMAEAIDYLARETAQTFDWFLHIKFRQFLKLVAAPFLLPLLIPKLLPLILSHIKTGTVRIYHVITHEVTHTATRVVVKTAAVAIPGAHAIPGLRKEVHGLARWAWRVNRRLRRVEALFGVTALAAAMANVFGLPNWRCLTRGNVGRLMRGVCGFPSWIMDVLLLGTIEGFAAVDLCAFEGALIKAAEALRPALRELVTVEDALIHCPSASYPTVFQLPPVSLPDLVNPVSLAA